MGNFVSALVGSYSSKMLQKEQMEQQKDLADKKARIDVLSTALSSGKLTPQAQDAALDQLEELTGGSSKKGGIDIKSTLGRLIGQYHKTQTPSLEDTMTKQQGAQDVTRQGGTRPETLGDIPPAQQKARAELGGGQPMLGEVPTAPGRPKVFKDEEPPLGEREKLDIERKNRLEEMGATSAEEDKKLKAQADIEDKRLKASEDREDARLKEQDLRAKANQYALDHRLDQQQAFQERMRKMSDAAAADREMKREIAQFRLTDVRAADALDKTAVQQRRLSLTSTLQGLQQQLTQSTGKLKERETAAQKQSWYQFYKDSPDTQGAQGEIDNTKAAISFLSSHKDAIISGKEDMDDMVDKANDIIREGQTEWSRGAWATANPGQNADAAAQEAKNQGMKVVP